MASSQMGMWQGSLEVFCGAILNKKSSLPRKKRGLDLRNPSTVASPSPIIAFNTFSYPLLTHTHSAPTASVLKFSIQGPLFGPLQNLFDVFDAFNRSRNGNVKIAFIQNQCKNSHTNVFIIILDAFDTKCPLRPMEKLERESLVDPPPLLALSLKQPYFSVPGGERGHKSGK